MKKRILLLIMISIIVFSSIGCQKEEKKERMTIEKKPIIIDVRTKEEYEEGHIKGAINIPYDQIDENIKLDKTQKLKVYCKSGKRSAIAYEKLKELGYDVDDLGAYDTIELEKE